MATDDPTPATETPAMIAPIQIHFDTQPALKALSILAQAALDKPDLIKAVAELKEPLFEGVVFDGEFHREPSHAMTVSVGPTPTLRRYLEAITGRRLYQP